MMHLEYTFDENNDRALARKILEDMILNMAENRYGKSDLIIDREKGKPYFKNHNNLYFNGTHSSDLFAVIMSDEADVGIDAEKIIDRDYLSIAKEYFYESEYKYLESSLKLEIDFFTIWTLKEAYVKMLGKTIFDIKNSIEIDLIERVIRKSNNFFFSSFILDDSYIVSLCYDMNDSKEDDIVLKLNDFNLNLLFSYPYLPNIDIYI
ncbi:4'-phosphopantetheinyl transferase family protein [Brachyspira alvinipulli]|uniref:4'-phosphopantetheinyl transferase family protein n=1 Tax=Brachyspira alvinipulli TaxID=84379 RepID=UPI00047F7DCE|nr:4'-phosphopantetheinyl transferase superfamily protein [Brachyspira alvinipulli]